MLRLRQYKECDAAVIAGWIKDKDVYLKWGGELFGEYPVSPETINETYTVKNGLCKEPDNFYPWVAFDDEGRVTGHFIMRYLNGDKKLLRFGWVIVDDSARGKGYGTEMLRLGLEYAFGILKVDKVTMGVFENNDIAHNCYRRVGFADTEVVEKEPWNVIEMAIRIEDYQA